jgi:hypothetical protein
MDELSSLSGHLMEPLASISAHTIVYFDCDDTLNHNVQWIFSVFSKILKT